MMYLSNVKLIALHGASGVGKDTLVAACKKLPLKVLHLKFATVLRVVVYILNDLDTSKIGDKYYELENGVTQKLIDFNAVYTTICPELLILGIKACIYYKRNTPWDVIVISDLRQPNEYDAIKAMGGVVVRLTRSDVVRPVQSMDNLLDNMAANPMRLLELFKGMHVNHRLV